MKIQVFKKIYKLWIKLTVYTQLIIQHYQFDWLVNLLMIPPNFSKNLLLDEGFKDQVQDFSRIFNQDIYHIQNIPLSIYLIGWNRFIQKIYN